MSNINLLLNHGIDTGTSCLHINGSVDSVMYNKFLTGLAVLNKTKTKKPIKVIFNTDGGDVEMSFAIYDLIVGSPRPVHILVNGPCFSAGIMILAAAERRFATYSSRFLIHFGPQSGDSKAEWQHEERAHELYIERTTNVCSRTYVEVEQMYAGETYFGVDEALEMNLINEMVWRL